MMISLDELLDDKETRDLIIEKLKKYGYITNLIADYYIYEVFNGEHKFIDIAFTEAFADHKIREERKKNPHKIYLKKCVKIA